MKNVLKIFASILCLSILLLTLLEERIAYEPYTSVSAAAANDDTKYPENMPLIVIDAGHGGEDGGAVSESGVMEKDINLDIALYLRDFFLQGGFEVLMIRQDDRSVHDDNAATLREKKVSDIHNRSAVCNSSENNIYISIHQNKFSQSKYSGAQVFYSENSPLSELLAENIRLSIKSLLQKDNERKIKSADKSIYILDKATVPCVLVECGFLSNERELSLLTSDDYKQSIAYCIYLGFCEFYYNNYDC